MKLYIEKIPAGDIAYRGHLILPDGIVREAEIPDFRAEIKADRDMPEGEAVRSARLLRDSVKKVEWPDQLGAHVLNIIRDPQAVFSALSGGPVHGYQLINHVEQAPNPQSRIALADERDVLGVPIATIDWRLSEVDKLGIQYAHQCIAREVGRSGFGRMLADLPKEESEILAGASGVCHHIGTTRMHDNPRLGVVDRNCAVHGSTNLFIAGSSVFPTGGFANPTFTIVALAIRLGDHVKMLLQADG
jgi:choline dehydrogenase-like flavoprotein